MKVPQSTFVLVALAVAACAPNYLDGNDYRFVGGFPCHPDGSVILAQKANSTGGFTKPTETPAPCTPADNFESAWGYLDEMGREADYRWLGLDVTPGRAR